MTERLGIDLHLTGDQVDLETLVALGQRAERAPEAAPSEAAPPEAAPPDHELVR